MGRIRLVQEGMPDLLPMFNRSPGVHVSSIINDLCLRLGHYDAADRDEQGRLPLDAMNRMALGSALEHAIVARFALDEPGRYTQPGELEMDGLFGTPDLLDTVDWAILEMKLTWMSSRHDPAGDKLWRYWVQIKAYCSMLDCEIGRLHVCHVNGDYRESGPVYRVWEQRFTARELAENWAMLVAHDRKMRSGKPDASPRERKWRSRSEARR